MDNGIYTGPEIDTTQDPTGRPLDVEIENEHNARKARMQEAQTIADSAKMTADATKRLEQVAEAFSKTMEQRTPPAAVFGSATEPSAQQEKNLAAHVERLIADRKLQRVAQPNGDISYLLPNRDILDAVAATLVTRTAFIERAARNGMPAHIELTSSYDRAVEAAVQHAAAKWGSDGVLIHAQEKHAALVVKFAVVHGLNIANKDPHTIALVTAERERTLKPLTRESKLDHPLLERVAGR